MTLVTNIRDFNACGQEGSACQAAGIDLPFRIVAALPVTFFKQELFYD